MPLVQKFQNVTFSLEYDTLTAYPNREYNQLLFRYYVNGCKALFRSDHHYAFESMQDQKEYSHSIQREESDHDLFHRDSLDKEETHYHFKYKKQIDRDTLIILLNLGKQYKLINEEELKAFLSAYDKKYNHDVVKIVELLMEDKKTAITRLNQFIKSCEDNTLLLALHQHLLKSGKYNDFIIPNTITSALGELPDGIIGPVSKKWAVTEKSFELQMINNIQTKCQRFTKRIALEKCSEFSSHLFFSTQRMQSDLSKHPHEPNKVCKLFQEADDAKLNQEYYKHFSGFKKS